MMRFTQFSAAFLLSLVAAIAVHAAERPAAVLAFDSSNSMWTEIDGTNKVVILREIVGKTLKSHDGRLDLGMITYGAKAKSCTAVETVAPLGQLDAADYFARMEQVVPAKGATPLGRVLRASAELAEYEARPATVILVTDGLDNCRADPCAIAAELEGRSKDLAVHVIAFDANDQKKLAGLSCIAEETGGSFFPAATRAEFDAAVADAFALAESQGEAAPSSNVAKKSNARADRGKPEEAETMRDPDAPPLPPERPEGGAAAVAAQDPAARVETQLEQAPLAGPANVTLTASLIEEGDPLDGGIMWRVFDAEPDKNGVFKVVARSEEARPVIRLKAGRYVVHAAFGRATATKEVELTGENIDARVVLNAGFMRLAAIGPDNQPLGNEEVSFSVYSSEQDQFGERKLVFANAEQDKIIRLNAGAYQVMSQIGDANAVTRGDVTVEPGKLSEVLITHRAAMVTLKLVNEAGGEALADTSWSVLTPQGDIVAEAVGAFPSHILAEGDYNVIARHDGKAYSKAFTVRSGIDREVEIVAGTGDEPETTDAAPAGN